MDTLFPGAQILNMNPSRDPCVKDGLYLARLVYNGTSILICSDKFETLKSEEADANSLALGLGLGLGLGIPFLCILGCWAWSRRGTLGDLRLERRIAADLKQPMDLQFPREEVERVLTAESLNNFRYGSLTDTLKKEIMLHRLKEGRDLREFIKYAEQCRQPELATWIERLNTGTFPPDVHEAWREYVLKRDTRTTAAERIEARPAEDV